MTQLRANQRHRRATTTIALMAVLAATACSDVLPDALAGGVTRSGLDPAADPAGGAPQAAALDSGMEDGSTSVLIEDLLNRRSALDPGPLRQVADAVMAANARAAEADLRAAMLRSEAASTNWLPSIGPAVSLTSLGAVVTSLVLNQTILDFGARKAERDYALHDVEVAAVALATDSNARVMQALELYLTAEASRARAAVNAAAMERMTHFSYIMQERVDAGISDRADLQVIQQKQAQMASDLAADREAAASAVAELQAMAAAPLGSLTGLSPVDAASLTAVPLTVMRAEAESDRAMAAGRAGRAGLLPTLGVGATTGSEGSGAGLNLGTAGGLTFGMGAQMRATQAQEAAAAARVTAEREQADRALAALQGRLSSLRRQEAEARSLAAQAAQNYELFAEQQRNGQRGVSDVVSVFETKVRAERAAADLRYDIALAELRIAERLGTLVDGDRI